MRRQIKMDTTQQNTINLSFFPKKVEIFKKKKKNYIFQTSITFSPSVTKGKQKKENKKKNTRIKG